MAQRLSALSPARYKFALKDFGPGPEKIASPNLSLFRTVYSVISFKVLDHTQWPGTRSFCNLSGVADDKSVDDDGNDRPDNGSAGRIRADRRIPLFREYEMMVAKKVKNPIAPRVRPSYIGNIVQERLATRIPPPEKDRILIAMIQVGNSMPKPNIHCLATSEIKVQNLQNTRGGKNAKLRYREPKLMTTVVSINEPYSASHDIDVVSRDIQSLPFYHDLEDIWQSKDGFHSDFIAKEYLKHSNWSVYERISITDYCYTAMCVANIFRSKVKDFQQPLPLLNFFKGHVYKCSHLEYKMSYVLGVKIKGYYETEGSKGKITEAEAEDQEKHGLLMVRLSELKLASSTKGVLVDHPEQYTTGLFLL